MRWVSVTRGHNQISRACGMLRAQTVVPCGRTGVKNLSLGPHATIFIFFPHAAAGRPPAGGQVKVCPRAQWVHIMQCLMLVFSVALAGCLQGCRAPWNKQQPCATRRQHVQHKKGIFNMFDDKQANKSGRSRPRLHANAAIMRPDNMLNGSLLSWVITLMTK